MTAQEILSQLKDLGQEGTARVLMNHGAKQPVYGVKIEYLKKIVKGIKNDHDLAIDLFNSGVYDAMYLAGLVMDGSSMTKEELQHWAASADSPGISEYTVPWVASESPYGYELALEWIHSPKESTASTGWATLAALVSVKRDEELDISELSDLLGHVAVNIHHAPNRVRMVMNGFVISTGCYVAALTEKSLQVSATIGRLAVDMSGTSCKVPDSTATIRKLQAKGSIGKKRKIAKC